MHRDERRRVDSRSWHRRQRQRQRADRSARTGCLVLPAVVQRRSRFLLAAFADARRPRVISTSFSTAQSGEHAVLHRKHGRPGDAPRRRGRQRDRDHRFRTALQAARPHLPSDESRAHDPARRRRAAHHAASAPAGRRMARASPSARSARTIFASCSTTSRCARPRMRRCRCCATKLPFLLDREIHVVLGPDETLDRCAGAHARDALDATLDYWREWVRYLSIPAEWQDAVIRAAITLKLCQYEGTGAIVAAHDDVDSRSAAHGAQLGLPLLLAARRRFRRARAQPTRRDAQHGGVPPLSLQSRRRRGRRAAARVRHPFRTRADRTRGGASRAAIAAWGRCASATMRGGSASTTSTAASCSRRAVVLRPQARPSPATPRAFARLERCRRSRAGACTTARTPASGNSAAARPCTRIRA